MADYIIAPQQFTLLPIWKLQPAFIELAYTQLVEIFGTKTVDKNNLCNNLFKLDFIPQLRRKDSMWQVLQFQTDGVQLSVKLQTLKDLNKPPFNTDNLLKKGYDILPPKKKISLEEEKGLYTFTLRREASSVRLICKAD